MQLPLLILGGLVVVVLAAGLVLVSRWRPERFALLLAVVAIAAGLVATTAEVVSGVGDREVTFAGTLDIDEIRNQFSGAPDEIDPEVARTYGALSSADGEMTKPQASSSALTWWAAARLAPWLLAAIVLVLVFPVMRAAGRGDPFTQGATRRLTAVGLLLLLGIPGVAIVQFLAAEIAGEGSFISPGVEPSLTISIADILPGVLVLALVGIFRRGVELRELERTTI
jgi:hypothetical protein